MALLATWLILFPSILVLAEGDPQEAGVHSRSGIIVIETDKYYVSDVYAGHLYLVSKDIPVFDLETMNQLCKQPGGYLVELDDTNEQNFVTDFLSTIGDYLFYTGANDVESEGRFVYYNSQKPVTNVSWREGEPNNYNGNEDCVAITPSGLNDNRCDRSALYVCELPLF